MTDKQPEALRLAEWSNWFCSNVKDPSDFRWQHMAESAAELRRLHEANQKMMALCQQLKKRPSDYLCAEDWEALKAATS